MRPGATTSPLARYRCSLTPTCGHMSRSGHVEHLGRTPVQRCFPNGTNSELISTHNRFGRRSSRMASVFAGVGAEN